MFVICLSSNAKEMYTHLIFFIKFAQIYVMRYLSFLSLVIIFFTSCQSNDYTLNISADVDDEQQIYLIALDNNNQPQTLDTLYIKSGITTYSSSIEVPEMHYLLIQGNRDVVPVVLEPGEITVEMFKDSIRSSVVSGTKSNKEFKQYVSETTPIVDDLFSIQNEMRNAMISRDSLAFVDLQQQLSEMQNKFNDFQIDYVKNNSDSYISTLILEQLIGNNIIEKEEGKTIYDSFSGTLKKTKSGIKIGEMVAPPAPAPTTDESKEDGEVNVGDLAPDFTAPSVTGSSLSLSEVKGTYTILDFWASWCGPCRVDSPNIVKVHHQFKDKGLQIVGISLDKDKENWEKAIENDNLNWEHVSHLLRWEDPIAAQYGVRSIPQLFLLDADGNVIAKERHAQDFVPILEKMLL